MSRAALYALISTDPQLASLGLKQVYGFQAVDTPSEDEKPFIVIRWEESTPGAARVRGSFYVTLWVYDVPSDYTRISKLIDRCKNLLDAAIHVAGSDGWTITTVRWSGESQDLYDDVYECIVRTATFEVVARPS